MQAILARAFLVYHLFNSIIVCLFPRKLRSLLLFPSSWFPLHQANNSLPRDHHNNKAAPPSVPSTVTSPGAATCHSSGKRMDPTELKRVFQMFDHNGDGRITQKELSDSLENLGIFIPDKELTQMIHQIDVNGDGCVDIDEFGGLYKSIMNEKDEEDDMMEAFNVFDQNGDGYITVDELRSVLSSLGLKQGRTTEDCRKMIMKVDVDGDGMVNYKEFKQMMKGGGFSALT